MARKIRVGVVGVGYFGRFHAEKYAALPSCELVGVADIDPARALAVGRSLGVEAMDDHRRLLGAVDAVSIAVPNAAHFDVAREFLAGGVHVLLEKPITDRLETADALIDIARRNGAILQIGHIERFSSAYLAIASHVHRPLYVQTDRVSPFDPRTLDTDVVLDVMIHDIDLIMALVKAPVESVDAVGTPVLSSREDIANSRIQFANGCVANVTASRVSRKKQRLLRIFQPDSYLVLDFLEGRVRKMASGDGEAIPGLPNIAMTEERFEKGDSLNRELVDFLDSVSTGRPPRVDGDAGRDALRTALMITDSLKAHRRRIQDHL